MRRRARAIGFGCAALACAALAAAVAGGYRGDIQSELGPLRAVVVARASVQAHHAITAADVRRLFEVRRIPERFAPAGALEVPTQAIGRAAAVAIPAGSYVLAAELRDPGRSHLRPRGPVAGPGREPVEISVTGAEALAAGRGDPAGGHVDVVVTTEPGPGGSGRTYVAAENVTLLALSQSTDSTGGDYTTSGSDWTATLALTRPQALRLIQAENFARGVRLIPR